MRSINTGVSEQHYGALKVSTGTQTERNCLDNSFLGVSSVDLNLLAFPSQIDLRSQWRRKAVL